MTPYSNTGKVHLLWEQVRKETNLEEAIKMVADLEEQATIERVSEIAELRALIQRLDSDVDAKLKYLQKALYGNGDPSHSVVARLERIEEAQKKAADTAARVAWIVVSAVAVQIVLYLLNVL